MVHVISRAWRDYTKKFQKKSNFWMPWSQCVSRKLVDLIVFWLWYQFVDVCFMSTTTRLTISSNVQRWLCSWNIVVLMWRNHCVVTDETVMFHRVVAELELGKSRPVLRRHESSTPKEIFLRLRGTSLSRLVNSIKPWVLDQQRLAVERISICMKRWKDKGGVMCSSVLCWIWEHEKWLET